MKKKYIYSFLAGILILFGLSNCEADKTGFLITDETAGYAKDSLLVYIDPPATSAQARFGNPYFTESIEGVEGTRPLTYSLLEIKSNDGNVAIMEKFLEVKEGTGIVVIPVDHEIPVGIYWISLQVSNMRGSEDLKDILKIIVKENAE